MYRHSMTQDHVDVLIVGAGLSGIGAAHQLAAKFPDKTFTILESRDRLGGTWDLFRYPGVRSDSDMHTLGYRFRPWTKAKSIADGPSILEYLQDTARENGVERAHPLRPPGRRRRLVERRRRGGPSRRSARSTGARRPCA